MDLATLDYGLLTNHGFHNDLIQIALLHGFSNDYFTDWLLIVFFRILIFRCTMISGFQI